MLKSLLPLASFLVFAACSAGPANIGTKCTVKGDCGGGKHPLCVAGLNNTAKLCTHVCATNADCPFGFDCAVSDAALGRTCNKTLYATDKLTGDPLLFGKPCPTDDSVCTGTGDLNTAPTCRKGTNPSEAKAVALDSDPAAYCTGSCTSDNDCPLPMKCAADYDGVTKCLKRDVCDECKYDENCGYNSGTFRSDFTKCVPETRAGKTGHYCSKECATNKDCPGSSKQSKWMVCQASTDADGVDGMFCLHWYGSCVGDGEVCSPCKSPDDCKSGLKCIDNPYFLYSYPFSGERMCNKVCCTKFTPLSDGQTAGACADTDPDAACAGPNNSVCDYTSPNVDTSSGPARGLSNFVCTGDTGHKHPGVFACHL